MAGHEFTNNVKKKKKKLGNSTLSSVIESQYLMLIGQSHGDPHANVANQDPNRK